MSRNRQKPGRAKTPEFVPGGAQQLTAGPGPTFGALGKTWRLGFNDQDAKAALEELFRAFVIRREDATARSLGASGDDYWDKRVQPKLDAGHWTTFQPGWVAMMRTQEGIVMFVQSLLLKNHPDVSAAETLRLFADSPRQLTAAVEVIAPDFFAAVAVQMGANPSEARKAAAAFADSLRDNLARLAEKSDTTPEPTPPEPATSPT